MLSTAVVLKVRFVKHNQGIQDFKILLQRYKSQSTTISYNIQYNIMLFLVLTCFTGHLYRKGLIQALVTQTFLEIMSYLSVMPINNMNLNL